MLDWYLEKIGHSFRTPVLAVAIGFYLPLELSVPIFLGGILHYVLHRGYKNRRLEQEAVDDGNRRGLLFASGLITGEALIGILMAIPIVITGNKDVLAIPKGPFGAWPGIILLVGVGYWLYRTARGSVREKSGE